MVDGHYGWSSHVEMGADMLKCFLTRTTLLHFINSKDSKSYDGDALPIFGYEFGVPDQLTFSGLAEQMGKKRMAWQNRWDCVPYH